MSCPDITDWVAALISGTGDRVGGTRTPQVIRQCSVGLQSMAIRGDREGERKGEGGGEGKRKRERG